MCPLVSQEMEAFNREDAFDSEDFAEPPGEHRNLRRRGRRRRKYRSYKRRYRNYYYPYYGRTYYTYPTYRTGYCRTHYCDYPKTYRYYWDSSSSSSRSGKARK